MGTTDVTLTIYIEGKGTVLKESPLMALDAGSGKILAFGAESEIVAENSAKDVEVAAPLTGGKISNYNTAVKLFLCLLHKAGVKGTLFHKPQIAVSVPKELTDVEKKAFEDAMYQAGAGKVFISEMGIEELAISLRQNSDKALKGFGTIVGITKNE